MHVENAIRDFLLLKGVELFWVDSAVSFIRQGLAQNRYFASNVLTQTVKLDPFGHRVKSYKALLTVTFPDSNRKSAIELSYTFDPKRRNAHRLRIKDLSALAFDSDPE